MYCRSTDVFICINFKLGLHRTIKSYDCLVTYTTQNEKKNVKQFTFLHFATLCFSLIPKTDSEELIFKYLSDFSLSVAMTTNCTEFICFVEHYSWKTIPRSAR